MKKTIVLCASVAFLMTACDSCGFPDGDPNTTYTWTYTAPNGTKSSGEFTTDQYGQAGFDVPEGTDCNKVEVKKKDEPTPACDSGAPDGSPCQSDSNCYCNLQCNNGYCGRPVESPILIDVNGDGFAFSCVAA